MTDSAATPVPAPRRRWRRRLLVAAGLLIILIVGGVIAIRIVLAGDLPRRLIASQLEQSTGLRVRIGEARVTWGGRTTLREVSFALPLDPAPFFAAPAVEVRHAPLHTLVRTGDPGLLEISVAKATVTISQDGAGRWTPLRIASQLTRATSTSKPAGSRSIPAVRLTEATLVVTRPGATSVTLPLTVRSGPEDAVTYGFEAGLGASSVKGRLSTANLAHSVRFTLADIEPVLDLFGVELPGTVRVDADWDADVSEKGVDGHLVIRDARCGEDAVSGRIGIEIDGGTLTARGAALTVDSRRLPRGPLVLSGGVLRIDEAAAAVHSVGVRVPGLSAEVSGAWTFSERRGRLEASWAGSEPGLSVAHFGRAEVQAAIPAVGPRRVAGTIESSGQAAGGAWRAECDVTVAGPRWTSLRATIAAPVLTYTDSAGQIDASGARAELTRNESEVALASLEVPALGELSASARFDLPSSAWTLRIDSAGASIPRTGLANVPVRLLARGDDRHAECSEFHTEVNGLIVSAAGRYTPGDAVPLVARVQATRSFPQPSHADRVAATIEAAFDVTGGIEPVSLRGAGTLKAWNLYAGDVAMEPIEAAAQADISDSRVTFQTDRFAVDGATVVVSGAVGIETTDLTADVQVESIDLAAMAAKFAPSLDVSGAASARLSVSLTGLDPASLHADGEWSIADAAGPRWSVPEGRGRVSVAYPEVRVHDISLLAGDASITGEVRLDVTRTDRLTADISTSRWPLSAPAWPVTLLIDSRTRADIDLAKQSAHGSLSLNAQARLDSAPIASVAVEATLAGRAARTTTLRAEALGGVVSGSAAFAIDDWTRLEADLQVQGVQLDRLGEWSSRAEGVSGVVSGTLRARRADDTFPLAPLRIEADLSTTSGSHGALRFGGLGLVAFAGPDRVVIDSSKLDIASGALSLWSRLSFHDGEPFVQLSADAEQLDLDQIIRAVRPDAPAVLGTVSGPVVVGGYLSEPHRAFGEAALTLSDADLGRLPVISDLYGLLRLDFSQPTPSGVGRVDARLDGDTLTLARVQYFNRGADVFGSARIENIWHGAASEVGGTFAAAARPLKDSDVPFADGADRLLSALFDDAVSIRVQGTLSEPQTRVVPFADVASGFRRLLGSGELP